MARASLKNKTQVVYQSISGPTNERIRQSEGFFEIGGESRSNQKYSMQDAPIERLMARNAIEPKEYAALVKYRHHWFHGGHSPSIGGMDLNRVFASNPGARCGMGIGDKQMFHQDQYKAARNELGHKPGIVVDNVVCGEWALDVAGYSIGYSSPYRARSAVTVILRDSGYRLAKLWGIG
jgi:hypothetical protein